MQRSPSALLGATCSNFRALRQHRRSVFRIRNLVAAGGKHDLLHIRTYLLGSRHDDMTRCGCSYAEMNSEKSVRGGSTCGNYRPCAPPPENPSHIVYGREPYHSPHDPITI